MVGSLRKLLLVLPLLVSLTFPALAAPPKASPAAGLRVIETVMTLVRNEFLEEVSPARLVNGALDGMRLLLEERKLDADFLEHVPDSADRKEALAELERQYGMALERYPDLQQGEKLTMETIQGMLKALDDPYIRCTTRRNRRSSAATVPSRPSRMSARTAR